MITISGAFGISSSSDTGSTIMMTFAAVFNDDGNISNLTVDDISIRDNPKFVEHSLQPLEMVIEAAKAAKENAQNQ